MSASWLLFDIGNTKVKWGVLRDGAMTRTGSIAHNQLADRGFAALTGRLPRTIAGAIACNVAGPDFGKRFARSIGLFCGGDVRFVRSERSGYGLVNGYRRPRSLGADRWVAMIGARAEFRTALCVVDAGTAITIDAVDRDGQHLGGQIIPGLHLMSDALRTDTSDIGTPRRNVRDPDPDSLQFADGTDRAVRYGALDAVCGAIERSAKRLRQAKQRPKIILTGGDASRILKQLGTTVIHRPNLVLLGLAAMIESDQ